MHVQYVTELLGDREESIDVTLDLDVEFWQEEVKKVQILSCTPNTGLEPLTPTEQEAGELQRDAELFVYRNSDRLFEQYLQEANAIHEEYDYE